MDLATICKPLYRLTKKNIPYKWEDAQQKTFQHLKQLLSSENVFVHFDKDLSVGISCDASNIEIGAVLFHHYPDGSECPIANISKILSGVQRNYSQIQKEIMSIMTQMHANADVLSCFPANADAQFDKEEAGEDTEMVCTIEADSNKVTPADHNSVARESAKDTTISTVLRLTREDWPPIKSDEGSELQCFRQLRDQLAICSGCLVLGQ